ncbi:MAG: hypothetical protein K6F76_03525 [Clostridiales bacterium]|nr:hypothetical protein [Clostridiales bacterium]
MAYYTKTVNEYARFRAQVSREEAQEFVERELKCPECGFIVAAAFSDATGHFKIKCQKCKSISVLNFAYFRRQKLRHKH